MEQSPLICQGEGNCKGKKKYITWNADMDNALVDVLFDQMALGNKADPGWKPQAYHAAVFTLNTRFNISLTKDNIKNRLKSWGKHYTTVSEIIKQSGFSWDTQKKMITVDDENVWTDYVKSNPDASSYRYKVIENWDDIVLFFGKDKANGEGAETAADVDEVLPNEEGGDVEFVSASLGLEDIDASENFNIPTTHARTRVVTPPFSKSTKKRGRQMELASAVAEMSNSFKKYISAVKVERPDAMEVYEEVSNVVDLSKTERLDVCQRLISGKVEEFRLLKGLPDEDKKDWILLLLSRPLT
ncbi:hypothetical protein HHK36_031364 [Tetracentron sinense]|uniref:Myb/SANT-like domain-containing protein n=1 Tax=Tetracentron sinense TaxID=13715 RepID=A0A834YCR4_TETSI|nr:hypothetical protein HHK36_031364 [Tetracentron sinense]